MARVRSGERARVRAVARAACLTLLMAAPSAVAALEAGAGEAASHELTPVGDVAGPPMPSRVVTPSPPSREWRGAWAFDTALVGSGQLADLVSTEYALTRDTLREGNPLLVNRAVRVPAKLAVVAAAAWASHRFRRRGHHGRARALSVAVFAIGAGMAVHNARMAGQHR